MPISHTLKASSFLDKLIDYRAPTKGVSPIYQAVKLEVELMSRVWLSLPGNGNPLATDDPKQALTDLINFGAIKGPEEMVAAVEAISKAFSVYLTEERRSFVDLVGPDTIFTADVNKLFQSRRDDEVREQNELLTRANELNTKIKDVAAKLVIPLIQVPAAVVPQAPKEKFNLFSLLYVSDKPTKEVATATSISYWLLPPILDEKSSEDITKFLRIWDYLFVRKLEPEVVKSALKDQYGFSSDDLTGLLSRIGDVLNRQIDQSQKILLAIEVDFKLYQNCLTAALELQMMLVDVGNFFGFQVGIASPAAPKPKK